jgi:hypothetical protein
VRITADAKRGFLPQSAAGVVHVLPRVLEPPAPLLAARHLFVVLDAAEL